MVVVGLIKKGAYFDSVTLMTVGKALSAMDGVVDAAVVMGTRENKGILATSDLLTPDKSSQVLHQNRSHPYQSAPKLALVAAGNLINP